MGEVLPQGNPPKTLRGQPRTPVRLLAHEKAQRWNQCPRQRNRKEKGDDLHEENCIWLLDEEETAEEQRLKAVPE